LQQPATKYKEVFARSWQIIRRDWRSIPNILSYIRLLLIPIFIYCYFYADNSRLSAIVLVVSSITDIVDGFLARKFNMVTDFGKFIDPIADKLTQLAALICLTKRHPLVWILVALLPLKEAAMFLMGLVFFKRTETVNSAKWYGKMATVVTVLSLLIMVLMPGLSDGVVVGIITVSASAMIFSLIMYSLRYYRLLKNH